MLLAWLEQGEAEGRDDKQIHRGDMRGMIMQKSPTPGSAVPILTMFGASAQQRSAGVLFRREAHQVF